jgi:hypothetical protein
MITSLRLWAARFKLRLLDREIADSTEDYADAMLAHRDDDARSLRWFLGDLRMERAALVSSIEFLTAKQKGNT